ncbi:MAG: hypothetical protein JXM70_28005 [Pirellulales bacterium]|nr:hypothetical protein [Pirellulales bacterium]
MLRTLFLSVCCLACSIAIGAEPPNFQPWGGAAVSDWSSAKQSIMVSDMARSIPASALSIMKLKKGCWKVIPYEMRGGPTGNMVFAAPEANTPELTLPLGVEKPGWYAIFVSLYSVSAIDSLAWLRLDDEPAAVNRQNRAGSYGMSEEVFFKVAKLDENSRLHIAQQNSGTVCSCGVTHVRLIPLSTEEVRRFEIDRRDKSHRNMITTIDGFSFFYTRSPRTAAEVLREVEILRDTDVGTLILHTPGADKTNHPTKVGHMKAEGVELFPTIGDRHYAESTRALAAKNINPVKVLIDGAHDMGIKVHVGIRPAGWSFWEPYTDYWEPPFYRDNPQWRCIDRDGTPVTRMSWAVPQVRKHLIDVLREQVRFGADGANIVFNRGYPVVLYEPPAVAVFRNKHGIDPRTIPESDPRITKWWSDIVTGFFLELRAMLDEEEAARSDGKHLELSITVLGTPGDDLRFGVDIQQLVKEKLVDEITTMLGFGRKSNTYDLPLLKKVCQEGKIPFYGGVSHHTAYPKIPSFYSGGAKGVAVWDAGVGDIFEWAWVSRFGHAEETAWRLKNLQMDKPPRSRYQFHKLGDQIRDSRFGPYWGG